MSRPSQLNNTSLTPHMSKQGQNTVVPVTCTTGDAAVKEVKLEQASESDSSKPYRAF